MPVCNGGGDATDRKECWSTQSNVSKKGWGSQREARRTEESSAQDCRHGREQGVMSLSSTATMLI